ncbi:MAG: hypothetical protein ABIM40_10065 [Pseudomonadota bacterium]
MKALTLLFVMAVILCGTAAAEVYYYDSSGRRVTSEDFHRMIHGTVAPTLGEIPESREDLQTGPPVWAESSDIVLINPVTAVVEVQGEEQLYYRYSATFKGEKGGALVFFEDSCLLYGLDRQRHDTCYLRVGYSSPGAQTFLDGESISREFLIREDPGNPASVQEWKTLRIVGEDSRLTCSFEKNGFLSMDFLWPIQESFRVGSISLLGSMVRRSPVADVQEDVKASARLSEDTLPGFVAKLTGKNSVKFSNPNGFSVNISLRVEKKGLDFTVFPQDSVLVDLPDGNFDVYFVYSHQSRSLYRGKSFYLQRGSATFTVLRAADGQYTLTTDGN